MPLRRTGRPGLLGTVARTAVIAGTATMTANAISRHQQTRGEEPAAHHQQLTTAAPAPPPPPENDLVSQLARLAQLRDAGVLTKEEFQKAKAELLNG